MANRIHPHRARSPIRPRPRLANVALILPLALWTATIEWSDGMHETIATITEDQCQRIPEYVRSGIWKPVGREGTIITAFRCEPHGSFAPGWDCIQNFNCQEPKQ